MKKSILIIILSLIIIASCSKNTAKNQISGMNSAELYKRGWTYYKLANFTEAEKYFSELSSRPLYYLEGNLGLGWTYLKQYKYENSKIEFNKFFNNDSLDIILPADSSFTDGKAGLCFASSALHQENDVISNSSTIQSSWKFRFDAAIDYKDIILLKAISYYSLGEYALSLQMVQILDPNFTVDLTFTEGKVLLAQKIEALKLVI